MHFHVKMFFLTYSTKTKILIIFVEICFNSFQDNQVSIVLTKIGNLSQYLILADNTVCRIPTIKSYFMLTQLHFTGSSANYFCMP